MSKFNRNLPTEKLPLTNKLSSKESKRSRKRLRDLAALLQEDHTEVLIEEKEKLRKKRRFKRDILTNTLKL